MRPAVPRDAALYSLQRAACPPSLLSMTHLASLRLTFKRGALVAAANWPVVIIQFVAESTFKLLLAVPVVGGLLLVGLALGRDVGDLLSGEVRDVIAGVAEALSGQPLALASFVVAFSLVLFGGSAFMFLIKGGTVSVVVEGHRHAGAIEQPPLRLPAIRRAARFSLDLFAAGCRRLFRRYLRLGLVLLGIYGVSGAVYLLVVVGGFRLVEGSAVAASWTMLAAAASTGLIAWITLVNLLYLLVQMVVAADDCSVRLAARRVAGFLRTRWREVGAVFGVVLGLVVLATAASVLAAAGLGLISFVPLVGLAVFPLQAAAWLVRGLIFQYLGLTALGAYLALYRPASQAREAVRADRARSAS